VYKYNPSIFIHKSKTQPEMTTYCPESPATALYNPVSPKYDGNAYTPESPNHFRKQVSPCGCIRPTLRKKRVVRETSPVDLSKIDPNTHIGKILGNMLHPLPVIKSNPFRPIDHWESYVISLRNNHKHSIATMDNIPDGYIERCEAIVEKIIIDHTKFYHKHPLKDTHKPKKVDNLPKYMDHIPVKLNVTKSGKVRVNIQPPPMMIIHEKYFSKGTKPPIGEYIRALKSFGYSDDVLERVLKHHENLPKRQAEMDEVFKRVFGSTSTSKASKPKRKPVMEEIMKKLKNLKNL
jgi:hypothetical protein